jgi:hypothetical protein
MIENEIYSCERRRKERERERERERESRVGHGEVKYLDTSGSTQFFLPKITLVSSVRGGPVKIIRYFQRLLYG